MNGIFATVICCLLLHPFLREVDRGLLTALKKLTDNYSGIS